MYSEKHLKKLGSGSTVRKFNTRIVYNSKFVNLFSDVVKRKVALTCTNTSVETSTLSCQNMSASSVNRGHQSVDEYEGRISRQGGNE